MQTLTTDAIPAPGTPVYVLAMGRRHAGILYHARPNGLADITLELEPGKPEFIKDIPPFSGGQFGWSTDAAALQKPPTAEEKLAAKRAEGARIPEPDDVVLYYKTYTNERTHMRSVEWFPARVIRVNGETDLVLQLHARPASADGSAPLDTNKVTNQELCLGAPISDEFLASRVRPDKQTWIGDRWEFPDIAIDQSRFFGKAPSLRP